MIDVLRIAHLRIAPQEGNLEVGNCEGNRSLVAFHLKNVFWSNSGCEADASKA